MTEFALATQKYTEVAHLAPDDTAREIMQTKLSELREDVEEIVFISFPGDEKRSGGMCGCR